ncbi:hypothetical protein LB504_006572 [Fusarium proliferatum]|nr:hypothetical protein LB504_006572 [Fusarium proliferatum]
MSVFIHTVSLRVDYSWTDIKTTLHNQQPHFLMHHQTRPLNYPMPHNIPPRSTASPGRSQAHLHDPPHPTEELPFLEVLCSTPAEMHNNHMGSAMDSLSTILLRPSSAAARR